MSNALQDMAGQARRVAFVTNKHRVVALLTAAAITLLCAAGMSLYTDRYEARARVHVDTQTVLKPMMASLTYQPDIDQQVGMLARTLISRPNMERLVDMPEVGLATRDPDQREALVSGLMKNIKIVPTGTGNIYDISYRGSSPQQAQRLVQATLAMFVQSSTQEKRRDAEGAGKFIEEQIRTHETKLIEAEENLKQFRTRNFGVSGVSEQDYYTRVSAATEQVDNLQVALRAAVQGRDAYRRELAQEDPQLPQDLLVPEGVPSEQARRLEAQRSTLEDLRSRYTDIHPDVITARRVLAQLEGDQAQLLARLAPTRAGRTGRAATSPVYQKLRISLAEAEAEVASLQSQLSTKQAHLAQVRSLANRAPQVEAEHAQLNRDYDVVRKNYDSLVARRESAVLGERLDASSQLADFRVTEPPRVSERPVPPSRVHLALLAVVVSLAGGVLAALLVDLLSPTVDDMAALRALTERATLGAVTVFHTPDARRHELTRSAGQGLTLVVLLSAQAAWIGWLASTTGLN